MKRIIYPKCNMNIECMIIKNAQDENFEKVLLSYKLKKFNC